MAASMSGYDAADLGEFVKALNALARNLHVELHKAADRAERAEADVERLTRERDEARRRHEALRADMDRYVAQHSFPAPGGVYLSLSQIIHRDDERGRDA